MGGFTWNQKGYMGGQVAELSMTIEDLRTLQLHFDSMPPKEVDYSTMYVSQFWYDKGKGAIGKEDAFSERDGKLYFHTIEVRIFDPF